MSRVLVAGCGYVGTALGLELAAAGDTVFGLRRDPSRLPSPIAPLAADLSRPATLTALPAVDAVVYAAAATGFAESAYHAAYVEGLANLLAALPHAPRRLIFVSSTSVYGQQGGEWVDEDSPAEAGHWSAGALRAGEALAREGAPEAIVLRLGGIYGPGRTRLIDDVLAGAAYAAGGPRYTNRIHRDDCAGALAYLLRHPAPDPLYLGVDDEPAELRVVLEWLAAKLGAPPPRAAAADDDPRRERSNKRCSNARLRAAGYAFRFPTFRDGYAALLGAG